MQYNSGFHCYETIFHYSICLIGCHVCGVPKINHFTLCSITNMRHHHRTVYVKLKSVGQRLGAALLRPNVFLKFKHTETKLNVSTAAIDRGLFFFPLTVHARLVRKSTSQNPPAWYGNTGSSGILSLGEAGIQSVALRG